MVRLMGAALVAAGGAALGFQAAVGLRKQVRALEEMSQGLALLERELELNAQPLSRLLERGRSGAGGRLRSCFETVSRG